MRYHLFLNSIRKMVKTTKVFSRKLAVNFQSSTTVLAAVAAAAHTTTATSQPCFFSDACAATSKVGPATSTNSDGFSWPPTARKTLPLVFANPEKV